MIPLGMARWTGAAVLSLSLHAGAAAIWMLAAPPDQPSGGGGGGMEVSVEGWGAASAANPAAAPAAEPAASPPAAEPAASPPPADAAAAPPAAVQEPVSPTAAPVSLPQAAQSPATNDALPPPLPEDAGLAAARIVQAEAVSAVQEPTSAAAPPVPPATPPALPVPRPPKEPPSRAAQALPDIEPVAAAPERTRSQRESNGIPQDAPSAAADGPAEAADGPAEAAAPPSAGGAGPSGSSRPSSVSGAAGEGDVDADFAAEVLAWLARHQRYPARARARFQEGTALVAFVMDRQGRVLSSRLQRSSGYPMLDREALGLLARAEPLPAIPASIAAERLEMAVPIVFRLPE